MICPILSLNMFAFSLWIKQMFACSKSTIRTKKYWNMFTVNNKDTRMTPLTSLLLNIVNIDILKVGLSPSKRICFICFIKTDEKCFLFKCLFFILMLFNTHIAQYTRSKGNQIMKLVQLIEYNKRKNFL